MSTDQPFPFTLSPSSTQLPSPGPRTPSPSLGFVLIWSEHGSRRRKGEFGGSGM